MVTTGLSDHGDVAAAPLAHRLRRLFQQINAIEDDAAASGRHPTRQQAHHRMSGQ
jgi:hypothetical protein